MQKQRLYLFVGYPGAGKTTIAKIIHELTGAVHLWADFERHVMFDAPTHSKAESRILYDHLNHVTGELLEQGKSVIFDTNFNYRKDRDYLREMAARHGAEVVLIWVTTPQDTARKRATEESDGQDTRIWGNMALEDFRRMSDHLQEPDSDEAAVKIEGIDITPQKVKQRLGL